MIDPNRIRIVQAAYEPQIQRAADDFGDHEGVGIAKISRWMTQFEDIDLPLAAKILSEITFYSSSRIRAMVRRLVETIYDKYDIYTPDRIIFIPIGNPFEGSAIVTRALRDIIGEQSIMHMSDLEDHERGSYDMLVFLDDFSGTGRQLEEWWEDVESIVLPREVHFIIALLVLNSIARPKIEEITVILCIDELDEQYNVISLESTKFLEDEKIRIVHYCVATRCAPRHQLGYDECGLLIVFKHGCPDNSLPILWHTNNSWEGLFRRSGL